MFFVIGFFLGVRGETEGLLRIPKWTEVKGGTARIRILGRVPFLVSMCQEPVYPTGLGYRSRRCIGDLSYWMRRRSDRNYHEILVWDPWVSKKTREQVSKRGMDVHGLT